MTTYLIAPPGTRVDEPGWHTPPEGLVLTWTIEGVMPPVAVQRDGILVATGIQAGYTADEQRSYNMKLYGPCERCGTARTVVKIGIPPHDVTLTLICPAGCDQEDSGTGAGEDAEFC